VPLVRWIPISLACLHVRVPHGDAPFQEPHKAHAEEHERARLRDRRDGLGLPCFHHAQGIPLGIECFNHEGLRPRWCVASTQPHEADGERVSQRGVCQGEGIVETISRQGGVGLEGEDIPISVDGRGWILKISALVGFNLGL
jgi:hypothetical protein